MAFHTLIHIGDVHLQSTNPRNPDRLRALDQVITESNSSRTWRRG
jgi:hypothetical protein